MRAIAAFMLLGLVPPFAQDWPQFRGPDGQGHAPGQGYPLEWSESQHVRWKVPVTGRGWSSPVVANGRVWLTTATRAGRDTSLRLLSFDVESGRAGVDAEIFRMRGGDLLNPKNSHASPTPIVDGDRVYVHFGAEGTAAVSTAGEVVWKAKLPYVSQHGNGGSPALAGDLLIVNCDGFDEAFVAALDVKTGKTRWRSYRPEPHSQAYSTPLAIEVDGRPEVVSVGAFNTIAYDPRNGREIWRVHYDDGYSNVPRPVFGQGLVYVATGFNQPSLLAVRPDGRGDVTRSHVAWRLTRGAPLTPSPVLDGDTLYLVSDNGIATAVDARTGAVRWQQRLGGAFSASPIVADGRVYFLDEDGRTTVVRAGGAGERLAVNALDGPAFASMAAVPHGFIVRTGTHLYRIE